MNATHQRKVLLMNNITGELYNVEGVITSIMFSSYYYLYINLLETQLRTSLGILGDSIVLFDSWTKINSYETIVSTFKLSYWLQARSLFKLKQAQLYKLMLL
jgi:hypothetical protein